jgi:hypothetical protein
MPGPRHRQSASIRGWHHHCTAPGARTRGEEALNKRDDQIYVAAISSLTVLAAERVSSTACRIPEDLTVLVEHPRYAASGTQHLGGNGSMPRAQLRKLAAVGAILALASYRAQQRIGDALQADNTTPGAPGPGSRHRDLAEAIGVGSARSPELVHDPRDRV